MRGATCPDCNRPVNACTCHEDKLMQSFDKALHVSNRGIEWSEFATIVGNHIEVYTVPQYGDAPDDNVESWTARDVEKQIEKYVRRFGANARGFEESQRDLLKIAHYCAILHNKRLKEAKGE